MKSALLAFVVLCCVGFARAQNLDVMGISLGSSYADGIATLASQGFRNSPIGFPNLPQMTGTLSAKEEQLPPRVTKGRRFEYVIVQALGGKVVYIAHEVSYGDNPEPNDLETVQSLRAKYGVPSVQESPQPTRESPIGTMEAGSYIFEWIFDSSGKVIPKASNCGPGASLMQGGNAHVRYIGPASIVSPGMTCSKSIAAKIYGDPKNGQLVGSMYVTLSDVATLRGFFMAIRKARQDEVNRQGDAGRGVKAPL